jgi:hypothetical protein
VLSIRAGRVQALRSLAALTFGGAGTTSIRLPSRRATTYPLATRHDQRHLRCAVSTGSQRAAGRARARSAPWTLARLLDRVRDAIRARHYRRRTEKPTRDGPAGTSSCTANAIPPRWGLPRSLRSSARCLSRQTWPVKAGLATHLEAVKRQHERDSSSSEPAGSSCPGRCPTFRHSFASTCWRPRHPDGAGVARPPRRQHDYDLHPRPQPRPRRRSEPGRPPRRLVSEESQRRDTQPRGPDIPGLRNACARRGSCPPKARDARRSCSLPRPEYRDRRTDIEQRAAATWFQRLSVRRPEEAPPAGFVTGQTSSVTFGGEQL